MRYFAVFCLLISAVGCASKAQQVAQNSNSVSEPMRAEKLQSVTAHSTEGQQPPTAAPPNDALDSNSKWSQSGEAIDTSKLDAAITAAEKAVKADPTNDEAKKAAAQAYFDRAFALTEARQYASALGDYRRALKHDPNDAEATKWIDQIVSIYAMMKKQAPKEGEEPPPLPFKSEKVKK